jgi:hypothetical protein
MTPAPRSAFRERLIWFVPAAAAQDETPPPSSPPPKQEPVQAAPESHVSSLVHHLGDDLKHIPRRNSLYGRRHRRRARDSSA